MIRKLKKNLFVKTIAKNDKNVIRTVKVSKGNSFKRKITKKY